MPPRAQHQPLTADQVEQVIRLSMPQFQEAVRRGVEPLEKRLKHVERVQQRVIAIYGGAAGLVTVVWSLCGGWIVAVVTTKAKTLIGI